MKGLQYFKLCALSLILMTFTKVISIETENSGDIVFTPETLSKNEPGEQQRQIEIIKFIRANFSEDMMKKYPPENFNEPNKNLKYIEIITFIRANFSEDTMKKYPPERFIEELEKKSKTELLKDKLKTKLTKAQEYVKNNPKKVALATLTTAAAIGAFVYRKELARDIGPKIANAYSAISGLASIARNVFFTTNK